jgi:hypothetical protein
MYVSFFIQLKLKINSVPLNQKIRRQNKTNVDLQVLNVWIISAMLQNVCLDKLNAFCLLVKVYMHVICFFLKFVSIHLFFIPPRYSLNIVESGVKHQQANLAYFL